MAMDKLDPDGPDHVNGPTHIYGECKDSELEVALPGLKKVGYAVVQMWKREDNDLWVLKIRTK